MDWYRAHICVYDTHTCTWSIFLLMDNLLFLEFYCSSFHQPHHHHHHHFMNDRCCHFVSIFFLQNPKYMNVFYFMKNTSPTCINPIYDNKLYHIVDVDIYFMLKKNWIRINWIGSHYKHNYDVREWKIWILNSNQVINE